MATGEVARWLVAPPPGTPGLPGQRQIRLLADESAGAAAGEVPFHIAMGAELPRAAEVAIWLPAYRGKSLVPMLGWLAAARLAAPGASVAWYLDHRQGPDSIARLLGELGWRDLVRRRDGALVRLAGQPPAAPELPEPAGFQARIGERKLAFAADYGVFSPKRVDAGTALLAEVALAQPPVPAVADIGVGYGPLAIGLVSNGVAGRAVATDVDSVGLWLALANAARAGVRLTVACSGDPAAVEPTGLTVCNVPTHIDAARSRVFLAGLARRAWRGQLLIVVHRGLEHRYTRHLTGAGLQVRRHGGPAHTVLAAGRRV